FRPTTDQRACSLPKSSVVPRKLRLEELSLPAAPNNGGECLNLTNAVRPGEAPAAESPTRVASGQNGKGAAPRGRDLTEETPAVEGASTSSLLVDVNQADVDVEKEGVRARRVAMVPSGAAAATEPDVGRGRAICAREASPAEGGSAGATEWGNLCGIGTEQADMREGDATAGEPFSGATLMTNGADATWPDIVVSTSSDSEMRFIDGAGSRAVEAEGTKPSGRGRTFGVTSPSSIDAVETAGSAAQASRPSLSLQSEGSVCSSIAASHCTSSSVASVERRRQLNVENIRRDYASNAEQTSAGLLGFPGAVGAMPSGRGDSGETSVAMWTAMDSLDEVSGPMQADSAQGMVEVTTWGRDAPKPREANEKADLPHSDDGNGREAGNAKHVAHASAETPSEDAGDANTDEAFRAAATGAASMRSAGRNKIEFVVARDQATHDSKKPEVVSVIEHTMGDGDDSAAAAEDVDQGAQGILAGADTDANISPATVSLISRPYRSGGAETDTTLPELVFSEKSVARFTPRSESGSGSSSVHDGFAKKLDRTAPALKSAATESPSATGSTHPMESSRKAAASPVSTRDRRRSGATLEELFPSRGGIGNDEPDSHDISVEEAAAFMGTHPCSAFASRSSGVTTEASTGGAAGALGAVIGRLPATLAKVEGLALDGTSYGSLLIADPHDFISPVPDGPFRGIRTPRISSEFVPPPMLSPGDPLRSNLYGAISLAGDAFVSSEGRGDDLEASKVQQPSVEEPVVVLAENGRLPPPRGGAIDVVLDPSAPQLAPSSETGRRGGEERNTPKRGPLAAVDHKGKDDEVAATAVARAPPGQSVAAPGKPPVVATAEAAAGGQKVPAKPLCASWSATDDASVNTVVGGGAVGVAAVDEDSEKIGGGVFGEGTRLPGGTMTDELSMIEGEAEQVHPSRVRGGGCCVMS
ncbi:unnamed protein product, partial [Ascophyllum nodosum]